MVSDKHNVFIDANIILNLYRLDGDLLNKFYRLFSEKIPSSIELFITPQLVDEVRRNREKVVKNSVQPLADLKESVCLFNCLEGAAGDNRKLQELYSALSDASDKRLERIYEDVKAHTLLADRLISYMFENAILFSDESPMAGKARLRMELGNPPGKRFDIGDALHWESLIKNAPPMETLFFVTYDRDFLSPLFQEELREFLSDEWKAAKKSEIVLYTSLSALSADIFPDSGVTAEDINKETKTLSS